MIVHEDLLCRLNSAFAPLGRRQSASLPSIGYLASKLADALPLHASTTTVTVSKDVVTAFATASVDAWLRGVQSFLVSCAVTDASPIWASVSGYYSSHYTNRALAHLLGHFVLFKRKKVVQLEFSSGQYQCSIEPKGAKGREHEYYWRVVKKHPQFVSDPLFTRNALDGNECDVAHRDRANYADHVGNLPHFRMLGKEALKHRIERISQIECSAPPIPNPSKFPDVESVQVVAYQRLVCFRRILDEGVSTRNRFWRVHREPSWAREFIDFQLTEQGNLRALAN